MLVTILYDRLYSDGSPIDCDIFQFKNEDFDLSIIPDIIASFYKSNDNKGITLKIRHIKIDRKGYES